MTVRSTGSFRSRLRTHARPVVLQPLIYGSNYRLSEWQGAILNVQLSRLDEQTKRRHQNSRLLDRLLSEVPGITPQKLDERCTRNGQYAYIFHLNKKKFAKISTERFIAAMNAEGIPNQASYPPLHELDIFRAARIASASPESKPDRNMGFWGRNSR